MSSCILCNTNLTYVKPQTICEVQTPTEKPDQRGQSCYPQLLALWDHMWYTLKHHLLHCTFIVQNFSTWSIPDILICSRLITHCTMPYHMEASEKHDFNFAANIHLQIRILFSTSLAVAMQVLDKRDTQRQSDRHRQWSLTIQLASCGENKIHSYYCTSANL